MNQATSKHAVKSKLTSLFLENPDLNTYKLKNLYMPVFYDFSYSYFIKTNKLYMQEISC